MIDEGMEQLLLYLNEDERLSATVMEFPIKMTAYGWQIASVHRERIDVESHEITDVTTEDITLEKHEIEDKVIYAGYGPATKTLVIGKPEQIEPVQKGQAGIGRRAMGWLIRRDWVWQGRG